MLRIISLGLPLILPSSHPQATENNLIREDMLRKLRNLGHGLSRGDTAHHSEMIALAFGFIDLVRDLIAGCILLNILHSSICRRFTTEIFLWMMGSGSIKWNKGHALAWTAGDAAGNSLLLSFSFYVVDMQTFCSEFWKPKTFSVCWLSFKAQYKAHNR